MASTINPDKLKWDSERQRFVNSRGRVITPAELRGYIDKLAALSGRRLHQLGLEVMNGSMRIARWQALAAKEIKNVHTAAFVIAQGGQSQMDQRAYRQLQKVIKFQLTHLRDFAESMPRSVADRTGRIPPRLQSYGFASMGTYENATLDRNREFGLSIARRLTGYGSRSCDECLDEEDLGWQDIKEIRRIGDTQCGARCNCTIEYEESIP